jgi:hypothetical protein
MSGGGTTGGMSANAPAAAISSMVRPRSLAPRRANEETQRQTKVLSGTTTLSGGESEVSNPETDPSDDVEAARLTE